MAFTLRGSLRLCAILLGVALRPAAAALLDSGLPSEGRSTWVAPERGRLMLESQGLWVLGSVDLWVGGEAALPITRRNLVATGVQYGPEMEQFRCKLSWLGPAGHANGRGSGGESRWRLETGSFVTLGGEFAPYLLGGLEQAWGPAFHRADAAAAPGPRWLARGGLQLGVRWGEPFERSRVGPFGLQDVQTAYIWMAANLSLGWLWRAPLE